MRFSDSRRFPPEDVHAWVELHRNELPTDLAGIVRYPIPFRMAIVSAVAPPVRIDLWRQHLEGSLTGEAGLTPEQQSFLRSTISELPEILQSPVPPNTYLPEWEHRMSRLFSRELATALFGSIGPPEPPGGLPAPRGFPTVTAAAG